jgi:quercetin dioxygenase-like cupin family protein
MRLTATLIVFAALGSNAPLPTFAQDNPEAVGVATSEELMPASVNNAVGEPIAYPAGAAEISSWIASFEPGGQTALHQHPVPIYVYVMEGEFELRVDGGEPMPMGLGQAFIEPQNRNMQIFNVGDGPGRLLVVAMGEAGQPISGPAQ